MKIKSNYYHATLIALFIIIIWDALKVYLKLGSPIIQLAFLSPAILIGLIVNLDRELWKTIFSKPVSIWFIWIIFSLINTFILNDFNRSFSNPYVLASSMFVVLIFTLIIVNNKLETNVLINLLIFSYLARLALSFIFDTGGMFGGYSSRFGEEFNANQIGFGALFLAVLITIKKVQFKNITKIDIAIFVLAILVIFLTGSRKNFVSLLIIFIGYLYITRSRLWVKDAAKYLLYFSILFISVLWVLNNTHIGNRIVDSYYRTLEHKQMGRSEKMFDSRARYYIEGWELFKKNPINGIGLRNFQQYDYANKSLHTEYMTQITEGGLIGTALFVYFYSYILLNLLKIRKQHEKYRKPAEIYILSIAIMLILFLGTWIYRAPMMWVLIALSIRFIRQVKCADIRIRSHKSFVKTTKHKVFGNNLAQNRT